MRKKHLRDKYRLGNCFLCGNKTEIIQMVIDAISVETAGKVKIFKETSIITSSTHSQLSKVQSNQNIQRRQGFTILKDTESRVFIIFDFFSFEDKAVVPCVDMNLRSPQVGSVTSFLFS